VLGQEEERTLEAERLRLFHALPPLPWATGAKVNASGTARQAPLLAPSVSAGGETNNEDNGPAVVPQLTLAPSLDQILVETGARPASLCSRGLWTVPNSA